MWDEYNTAMAQESKEEMRTVCNLGEAIARRSREEGIAQGMALGMKQAAQLMAKLFSMGRAAEAEKASNDAAYMQKLLKEYEFTET